MADSQSTPQVGSSTPGSGQRGRRGGRRGGRGGRGGRSGAPRAAEGDNVPAGSDTAPHIAPTAAHVPDEAASYAGLHQGSNRGSGGGRGRADRSRRARGSRPVAQVSNMAPRRSFGGRLTSANEGEASGEAVVLSAAAPAFVPGQPVATSKPGLSRLSSRQNGDADGARQQRPAVRPAPRQTGPKSTAQDLPTRIHEDIDRGHYECVICTSEVVRTSKIWSCTICWTVTHMHCVKKWHKNQLQQQQDNPNPGSNQPSGWRCPGCNSSLQDEPGLYHCWCGKEINPKSIPGLSPHSCGQTCTRQKPTCPHPCPLTCHAGPCPPCTLMGPTQTCFCGKNTSTKRCTETEYGQGFSCQEICGDLLPCGEHACSRPCHPGLCGGCAIPIPSVCYCGKEGKQMSCDQRGDVRGSYNHGQLVALEDTDPVSTDWFEGCFECSNVCGRKFDCGFHTCEKTCHPQDDEPAHCPLSPDVVGRCPCGKTPLQDISQEPRTSCQDPIPHCDKPCGKPPPCGHHCLDKCHTGPCSPCFQTIDVSCRCGRTNVKSVCHQGAVQEPMCFRTCRAQLNCGRHECGERCCPGEKKAMERRKQKRTANANENVEAEHICLNACGRTLRCGKHTCEQLCHRGQCPSCLEAVFDEISCACGRTVLQPPQPCGTRPPECRFDCTRRRPCGHPTVSHQCHPDDAECPKCPFLVEKPCVCGRKTLKNQPCWFDGATCGLPCGKKLKCGAHECRKLCHRPGECEDVGVPGSHCAQPCGRVRKSCDHTCAGTCHAPYPCREDKPCQSKTFVTCPCQHRKQEIRCHATWTNPSAARDTLLKCDDECLRLQRNRRLADALNVDPDHADDHIPYADATLKLYRDNAAWAQQQEREFRVFASDPDERRIRFKPMPAPQRAFIHALAEDFGLDSESQDPEPHRHVAVFKTPRFVSAPKKTLSQCVRVAAAKPPAGPTATSAAAAGAHRGTSPPGRTDAFNALLLSGPRFGITIDELESALAPDLAAAVRRSAPATLSFATTFLNEHEVVVVAARAGAPTAAAVATAVAPQAVEDALRSLKPAVARTVTAAGLAGGVALCRVEPGSSGTANSDNTTTVVRREGGPDHAGGGGGWNAVASRGPWRRGGNAAAAAPAREEKRKGFGFVALRRLGEKKATKKGEEEEKEVRVEQPVDEDWLAAAEKMSGEGKADDGVVAASEGDGEKDLTGEDGIQA